MSLSSFSCAASGGLIILVEFYGPGVGGLIILDPFVQQYYSLRGNCSNLADKEHDQRLL